MTGRGGTKVQLSTSLPTLAHLDKSPCSKLHQPKNGGDAFEWPSLLGCTRTTRPRLCYRALLSPVCMVQGPNCEHYKGCDHGYTTRYIVVEPRQC